MQYSAKSQTVTLMDVGSPIAAISLASLSVAASLSPIKTIKKCARLSPKSISLNEGR